jgi:hypothetical protein
VKTLLRTYGGIFDFETKVNLDLIVKKTQLTEKKLISLLHQLESDEIIHLQLASSDSEISFLKPREDDLTINPILPVVRQQITQKKKQIESVIDYIKNDRVCRQMQLLTYFGEHINEPCGICSVCIQKSKKTEKPLESIEESILSLLHNNSLSSRELHESLNCNEDSLVEAIKRLLEGNKIEITTNNQYKCRDPSLGDENRVYGTPDFAVSSLKVLVENKYNIVAVITAPDKPSGRGQKLRFSAVKTYAMTHELKVLQPSNLKSMEFIEELQSLKPDIQVVVAFRMLPKSVWQLARFGTLTYMRHYYHSIVEQHQSIGL